MRGVILSSAVAAFWAINFSAQTVDAQPPVLLECEDTDALFLEKLGVVEPVAVVHPPGSHEGEEEDDDHDHNETEIAVEMRRMLHDNESYFFVGCNTSYFDVVYQSHLMTFLLEDFAIDDCNEFGCNCYSFRCLLGGGGHGHTHDDDHGRLLQHDHDEEEEEEGHDHFDGLDYTMNSAYYMKGHSVQLAHAVPDVIDGTCDDIDLSEAPHHTCTLAAVAEPIETPFMYNCTEANTLTYHQFHLIDPLNVIEPTGGHDHDRKLRHDSPIYFLGCNYSAFDVLYEKHIYTYELAYFNAGSSSLGGGCNCMVPICRPAEAHEHDEGEEEEGHDHDHGRVLFPRKLQDDDHHHDDVEIDVEGVNFKVHQEFYLEGYTVYAGQLAVCCDSEAAVFDAATIEATEMCSLDFLVEFAAPEAAAEDSIIAVVTIGALAILSLLVAFVAIHAKSKVPVAEEAKEESKEPVVPAGEEPEAKIKN